MKKIVFENRVSKELKDIEIGEIFQTESSELFIRTDGHCVKVKDKYVACVRLKTGYVVNLCEVSTCYLLDTEIRCSYIQEI